MRLVTAVEVRGDSLAVAAAGFPLEDTAHGPLETAQGLGSKGRKAGLIGTKCEPVEEAWATGVVATVAGELEVLAAADVACPV